MGWRLDWEVIAGARGRHPGNPDGRVMQGETVLFTLVHTGRPSYLADFERDPTHWSPRPMLTIIGSSVHEEPCRDSNALQIDYQFRWEGRKTLRFTGAIDRTAAHMAEYDHDERVRAERETPLSGEEAATMSRNPPATSRNFERTLDEHWTPIEIEIPFEVIPEATAGEAAATVINRPRRARARAASIAEDRGAIAEERESREAAEARDTAARVERLDARRLERGDLRRGRLPMDLRTDEELGALEEESPEYTEYVLDLRAAMRSTDPLDLRGNAARDHSGNLYTGRWTWQFSDGRVAFYFEALQRAPDALGNGARVAYEEEAADVRRLTEVTYGESDWIVARFEGGGGRRALFPAGEFARHVAVTRAFSVFEAVSDVMDAFDVVIFVASGGVGAVLAGVRRAARWLVSRATRVARSTAIHMGAAARRLLPDPGDVARAAVPEGRVGRELTERATGSADDAARGARETDDLARGTTDRGTANRGTAAEEAGRGVDRRAVPEDIDADVERAFADMVSGAPSRLPPAAVSRVYTAPAAVRRVYDAARETFNGVRDRFAQALGLVVGSGGQVHHAIELKVITRYGPDVFSPAELNRLDNMRGIPPERTLSDVMSTTRGRRQLHNSAIRARWDANYAVIDAEIVRRGLTPGTPDYRSYVRGALESGRDAIDAEFRMLFSEGRRTIPLGTPGMLAEDAASLGRAVPGGAVPDPPPRLRIP